MVPCGQAARRLRCQHPGQRRGLGCGLRLRLLCAISRPLQTMPFRNRLPRPACRQPWSPLPLAPSLCPASSGPQEASALFSLLTPLFALSLPLNLQVLFPPPPPPPQNSFSPLHGSISPAQPQPQGPIGLLACRSLPSSLTSWGSESQVPKKGKDGGGTGKGLGQLIEGMLPIYSNLIPLWACLPTAAPPINCIITGLFRLRAAQARSSPIGRRAL